MNAPLVIVRRLSPETVRVTFEVLELGPTGAKHRVRHHFDFSRERALELARGLEEAMR